MTGAGNGSFLFEPHRCISGELLLHFYFTENINGSCWYKRKSFEHEREVRAIVTNYDTFSKGLLIPVDLTALIDCLFISPYAPKWFEEVVRSVVEKYEINIPVVYSDMTQQPFY